MAVSAEVAISAVGALVSSLIIELRDSGVLTDDQTVKIVKDAYEKHAGKQSQADTKILYETMFSGLKL